MELITHFLLAIGSILQATISKLLLDDAKAWIPRVTSLAIERALRRLPADLQPRMREEWSSHINDVPGEIGKIIVACGFLVAARRLAPRARVDHSLAQVGSVIFGSLLGLTLIVLLLPLMTILVILSRLCLYGPITARHLCVGRGGRNFMHIELRCGSDTGFGRLLVRLGLHRIFDLMHLMKGDILITPRAAWRQLGRALLGRLPIQLDCPNRVRTRR